MSVPPAIMQQMRQGSPMPPAGGPPGAGAPPSPAAKPSPMAKPQDKKGQQEAARINIHIAMNMLEQALPVFGSETDEGRAILRTLSSLAKDFGKQDAGDLVPAEVMQMVKSLPQMGGGSGVQQQLQKQLQGGGAPPSPQPGGMPPGAPPMGAQ